MLQLHLQSFSMRYEIQLGKKTVQTISYLPHFLSWIIVTGIIHDALSGTGIINELLVNLNVINQPINFFAHKEYFWPIVAFANVWKETGWNAIIYLAAITAIDPSLYEAASIDGAGRWAKIKHITLAGNKAYYYDSAFNECRKCSECWF